MHISIDNDKSPIIKDAHMNPQEKLPHVGSSPKPKLNNLRRNYSHLPSAAAMNPIDDDLFFASSSSSSSSSLKDEKAEPQDLLEEFWFFGNLLEKKTRKKTMLRCHSDPCSSSNSPSSSPPKILSSGGLVRAPSLPSSMEKVKETREVKGRSSRTKKSLMRAPSLPPCIGNELVEDAEIDFTLSRLIRQASLNSNDVLPPKHASSKRPDVDALHPIAAQPKSEHVSTKQNFTTTRKQHPTKKSAGKYEEAPRFSDTYLTHEKKDVKLSVQTPDRYKVKRSYDLPESWLVHSSAPPVPKWVDKSSSSSAEDMKAHIKFWARAVAANTR